MSQIRHNKAKKVAKKNSLVCPKTQEKKKGSRHSSNHNTTEESVCVEVSDNQSRIADRSAHDTHVVAGAARKMSNNAR